MFMDSSKCTADFKIFVPQRCQYVLNITEHWTGFRQAVLWKPFHQGQTGGLLRIQPRQFSSQFDGQPLSSSFADPLRFAESPQIPVRDRADELS